jgi:GMP synthase-like glutamine amidotransferase
MSKRVLIIGGAIDRERYHPFDHWRRLLGSVPSDTAHLPSGEAPPNLDAYTHLIVTGAETSIVEPQPWYAVEEAVIREAFDRGVPILGSCFGHQMLVRTLSGAAYVRRAEAPEIGWFPIETTAADPITENFPNPWHAFHVHYDEVASPPAPWRVLARSAACSVQVIRYGELPVWGFQAHPEIDPDRARSLLQTMTPQNPVGTEAMRAALGQTPRDDGLAQRIVDRFLEALPPAP